MKKITQTKVKGGIELSIVLPCLNEERTVGTCVAHAKSFLSKHKINGEPGDLEVAYQIHVTTPPIAIEASCKKNKSDIWEIHPPSP